MCLEELSTHNHEIDDNDNTRWIIHDYTGSLAFMSVSQKFPLVNKFSVGSTVMRIFSKGYLTLLNFLHLQFRK